MKLSEMKQHLQNVQRVTFVLPSGALVPAHFHVTEVGLVTKHFIDGGGSERIEKVVNFQLWDANDTDHRLQPQKLRNIITLSEQKLGIGDLEIEVEYQSDTIGKYGLHFNGTNFTLVPKQTNCLAQDKCGVPPQPKQQLQLVNLTNQQPAAACCTPGGSCC
jgi:hypothetical protein